MSVYQGEAIVSLIGALFFIVSGLALIYEAYALWSGTVEPVTVVTRGAIRAHHWIALGLTGFVLILIGHFWR